MVTMQTLVKNAQRALADAEDADTDVVNKDAKLSAARARADQLRADLMDRIQRGESTGDAILDTKVMLSGTGTKDDLYERLVRLNNLLLAHPGELIMLVGGTDGAQRNLDIARLPEQPSMSWFRTVISPNGRLKIPVISARITGAPVDGYAETFETLLVIELATIHHSVLLDGSGEEVTMRQGAMAIGTEAVAQLISKLSDSTALEYWIEARLLDIHFRPHEKLERAIRRNREALAMELIEPMAALKELTDLFKRLQSRPSEAFGHPILQKLRMPDVTQTDTGVTLDFGLTEPIEKARQKLLQIVGRGINELEMHDNPTVQLAAIRLGITL